MAQQIEPAEIERAVRALIAAETTNLGVEITVPVAYGDGELATVIIESAADGYLVHDASSGAMRLSSAGVQLNANLTRRMRESAKRYRCDFEDGRVFARSNADLLPQVICLVANASRSVADHIYEIRRQAEHDFRTEVLERLREIVGTRIRAYEQFRGKSGRRYHLPIILDAQERKAQNFIAALAHRHSVPQGFAMLFDLGLAFPDVECDAVCDESSDIRPEDRVFLASGGARVMTLTETPIRFRAVLHG
jgi:hypothetical protein